MVPEIRIKTVPCDCDEITYQISILSTDEPVEIDVKGSDLLPLLGRALELLNIHRLSEMNKAELDSPERFSMKGAQE